MMKNPSMFLPLVPSGYSRLRRWWTGCLALLTVTVFIIPASAHDMTVKMSYSDGVVSLSGVRIDYLDVGSPQMKIKTYIQDIVPRCGIIGINGRGRAALIANVRWALPNRPTFSTDVVLREFSHGSAANRSSETSVIDSPVKGFPFPSETVLRVEGMCG
jgi:hypothetical protein